MEIIIITTLAFVLTFGTLCLYHFLTVYEKINELDSKSRGYTFDRIEKLDDDLNDKMHKKHLEIHDKIKEIYEYIGVERVDEGPKLVAKDKCQSTENN